MRLSIDFTRFPSPLLRSPAVPRPALSRHLLHSTFNCLNVAFLARSSPTAATVWKRNLRSFFSLVLLTLIDHRLLLLHIHEAFFLHYFPTQLPTYPHPFNYPRVLLHMSCLLRNMHTHTSSRKSRYVVKLSGLESSHRRVLYGPPRGHLVRGQIISDVIF